MKNEHTSYHIGSSLRTLLVVFISLLQQAATNADHAKSETVKSPVSAKSSLANFELAPGLRIELVASEPQVIDPVAVRFDEKGRMWVVEMRDYPHGPAKGEEPKSQIKILEDRDGDGHFETAKVFADKLLFVTGVQPWKGGAFVTMAGQVAYMKDTNGDGRADKTETWYTGFAQENSQLRANHPRFALDNHIYVANGLRGGAVVDARKPDSKPLPISGMDFRFDPVTRDFEAESGVGQFGLTFDDWGNRFVVSNRNPLKHIVIENRYLKRNPLAAIPAVFHDVAKSGADSRIYSITRAWTTSNLHAGQFTAACGVEIFRGDALPDAFYGNAFTCDPTAHIVHREIMKPAGATFTSKPARDGVEFLASRDQWFSPVNLRTGPDGALYVVDMYRAVIEHPQFVPTELKNRPDMYFGIDRGRIYRIVAAQSKKKADKVSLAKASGKDLVELFKRRTAWWRETAQRLLIERQDKSVVDALRKMVESDESPTARVHALWTLHGLGAVSAEDVTRWLNRRDKSPRVREHFVRLSEKYVEDSVAIRDLIRKHYLFDSDGKTSFHALLVFAPAGSDDDGSLVSSAALREGKKQDVWYRRAAAIAVGSHAVEFGDYYFVDPFRKKLGDEIDIELLTTMYTMVGADSNEQPAQRALKQIAEARKLFQNSRDQRAALLALCTGMRKRGRSLSYMIGRVEDGDIASRVGDVIKQSAQVAGSDDASEHTRVEAIQLLGEAGDQDDALVKLARNISAQSIRVAAISALSRGKSKGPWDAMLKAFPSAPPAIRAALLDAMLARTDRANMLLDAMDSGAVKPAEIDASRASRLLKHGDATVRKRAAKRLADAIPADRKKMLAEYQVVLKMKSNPARGVEIFKNNCATCHRVGNVGTNVAPDISDSRTKQPAQILTDIIQPNRAIDANYVAYVIITTDGRVLTGVLASETSTSITLRQPEDKTVTLLRSDIDEIRSTGISLMPEGLEKKIPHQDMADLISYIKNWRYLDGKTPLRE